MIKHEFFAGKHSPSHIDEGCAARIVRVGHLLLLGRSKRLGESRALRLCGWTAEGSKVQVIHNLFVGKAELHQHVDGAAGGAQELRRRDAR